MERKFLEAFGLGRAEVDRIMAAHGAGIERLKQAAGLAETEKKALAGRLDSTLKELEALKALDAEKLRQDAAAWEKKYREETAELKGRLEAESYQSRVALLCSGERFTSAAARRAYEDALLREKLPLCENGLEGYGEFRKAFEEKDPDAFAPKGPALRMTAPMARSGMRAEGWRTNALRNLDRARRGQQADE